MFSTCCSKQEAAAAPHENVTFSDALNTKILGPRLGPQDVDTEFSKTEKVPEELRSTLDELSPVVTEDRIDRTQVDPEISSPVVTEDRMQVEDPEILPSVLLEPEVMSVLQEPSRFQVLLRRTSFHTDDLVFDVSDNQFCLVSLKENVLHGLVAEWNEACKEGQKILPYDRLVVVNGHSSPASRLQSEFSKRFYELIMTVEHPKIQELHVKKGKAQLGLEFASGSSLGLRIDKVDPQTGFAMAGLRPYDRIVQVNGENYPSQELLKMMDADAFRMTVCSYGLAA